MKRIFTFTAIVITAALVLGGCVKNYDGSDGGINENYWLSKEQGEVVYSDAYCNYYVIETINGYTIVRASGYKPYEGAIVYGDFSYLGSRNIYNYSTGYVFSGTITDTWLDYYDAQDIMDYYCPLYGKSTEREFKKTTIVSNKKPAGK